MLPERTIGDQPSLKEVAKRIFGTSSVLIGPRLLRLPSHIEVHDALPDVPLELTVWVNRGKALAGSWTFIAIDECDGY